MKYLLAFLAITAAAFAASAPVVTVDLYGNVFLDGTNTNQQLADFARNRPDLAPQVDGAVRDLVIAARARIAADVKAAQDFAAVQVAAKEGEKTAAISAAESARDSAIAAHAAAKATEIAALQAQLTKAGEDAAAAATAHATALAAKDAEIAALRAQLAAQSAPPSGNP